jgi:UDP-N-acetylmuramoyl-tripeptide--D-alanyl-D-alanine ligase
MTITEALEETRGELRRRGDVARFDGVSIDSRQVRPGQAFVAIAGARFDGHRFWRQAVDAGATLLIVARDRERECEGILGDDLPAGVSVLEVNDTRVALGLLARSWRRRTSVEVVAITGSVGKTTTKELAQVVLSRLGSTHCNPGNFNNEIGLPLTLLSMPAGTRYLVTEMGMNAPGEIAYLTDLTRPDVGVITCVAPVHLEGLGSLEAVAAAKGELLQGLPDGAWAVVPGQEPLLEPALGAVPPGRRVRFGESGSDEVQILEAESLGPAGCRVRLALRGEEVEFRLPLVGIYNARNAAAAAAAAMVLGLCPPEIAEAMETAPAGLRHRSSLLQLGRWHVLDDCYNANPVAMRAALDTLRQLAGRSQAVAVLGEMLELGPGSPRFHREVGEHAAGLDLAELVTVGAAAAEIARGAREAGMASERIVEVAGAPEAAEVVAGIVGEEAWILVKASRGSQLEQVIEHLSTIAHGGGDDDCDDDRDQ